jgi:hypothetical protein
MDCIEISGMKNARRPPGRGEASLRGESGISWRARFAAGQR